MREYMIYQLKDSPETEGIRFMDTEYLQKLGHDVRFSDYDFIFKESIDAKTTLDDIYERLNKDRPEKFTGHSLSVSDLIVLRDDKSTTTYYVDRIGFTRLPVVPESVPVYRHTLDFANRTGERDAWRASRDESVRCARAIDKAVAEHFDGMHLTHDVAAPVVKEFGADRVEWVLANTLMLKDYDGRFSHRNKEWGAAVGVPYDRTDDYVRNDAFELTAHPAVLDGFIDLARKEIESARAQEMQTISVLVVEPGKKPYEKEIPAGLEGLQKAVGGYIEAVYPYEDPVALIVNEEGKLNGMAYNRALRDEDGEVYDVLVGTFLVVGVGEEDFSSLSPELMRKYGEKFETPERFIYNGNRLVIKPVTDEKPSLEATLAEKKSEVAGRASPAAQKNREGNVLE